MELTWDSREVRDLCEKRECAMAQLGDDVALELGKIVADLEAVASMAEFLELADPDLILVNATEVVVILETGPRLVLGSGHPDAAAADDPPEWATVTRCRIRRLEHSP